MFRKMGNKLYSVGLSVILLVSLLLPVNIFAAPEKSQFISQTSDDTAIIPDKYNTGCSGKSKLIDLTNKVTINGIVFKSSGNNAIIDSLENGKARGTYTFENIDFSKYTFTLYRPEQYASTVEYFFKNCKFGIVSSYNNPTNQKTRLRFENCSITSFNGSDASFDRCAFGGSYRDGIVPFQNVTVKNCYFSNFNSSDPAGATTHVDGMQAYGAADTMVKNVIFDHCRMEMPPIPLANGAYINSCIMYAMEYNNSDNVIFRDCWLNGGGYTIYAGHVQPNLYMSNSSFENIRIGNAARFGAIYNKTSGNDITFSNINDTNSLYIGTIWKSNGQTHLSVTNDTADDRSLRVFTDTNNYTFKIPACPSGRDLATGKITFTDLPFDMDIVIPEDCHFVVCYDDTFPDSKMQIRSENWDSSPIPVAGSLSAFLNGKENLPDTIMAVGSCGKNVEYTLYNDGLLVLSGKGATYDFNSNNRAPWFAEYREQITSVEVHTGVTVLGAQLFSFCPNLKSVILEEGVENLRDRSFYCCPNLTDIKLPSSLKTIGSYVFETTDIQLAEYNGTLDKWNEISRGSNNGKLEKNLNYIRYDLSGSEIIVDYETYEYTGDYIVPVIAVYFEGKELILDKDYSVNYEGNIEPGEATIIINGIGNYTGTAKTSFVIKEKEEEIVPDTPETSVLSQGACGSGVIYTIYGNGRLLLSGTGATENYCSSYLAPWYYEYKDFITSVEVESGVQTIGNFTFSGCSNLTTVYLHPGVQNIMHRGFYLCNNLSEVWIPSTVNYIGEYSFYKPTGLFVHYSGDEAQWNSIRKERDNDSLESNIYFGEVWS